MAAAAYLRLYNLAQAAGWTAALAASLAASRGPSGSVYAAAAAPIRELEEMGGWRPRHQPPAHPQPLPPLPPIPGVCQGAALLETAHVVAGLVKGSAPLALLQWFGRSNVLFLILGAVPEVREIMWGVSGRGGTPGRLPTSPPPPSLSQVRTHPAILPLFLAWAAADVVRYAWYASGTRAPAWLTWARYSAFIPLYPLGIFAGEMPLIAAARPFISKRRLWCVDMPNAFNWGFDYSWFCGLGLYLLLPAAFLHLYGTLLAARKRRLGPHKKRE